MGLGLKIYTVCSYEVCFLYPIHTVINSRITVFVKPVLLCETDLKFQLPFNSGLSLFLCPQDEWLTWFRLSSIHLYPLYQSQFLSIDDSLGTNYLVSLWPMLVSFESDHYLCVPPTAPLSVLCSLTTSTTYKLSQQYISHTKCALLASVCFGLYLDTLFYDIALPLLHFISNGFQP